MFPALPKYFSPHNKHPAVGPEPWRKNLGLIVEGTPAVPDIVLGQIVGQALALALQDTTEHISQSK